MQIILDVSEWNSPAQLDLNLAYGPDDVVGVYIKATQDTTYRNRLCDVFAGICVAHNTPFGYYDYLTNADCSAQEKCFHDFTEGLKHRPSLVPMLDCEGGYAKYAEGALHWATAFAADEQRLDGKPVGGKLPVLYASLADMSHYRGQYNGDLWVAQYFNARHYEPNTAATYAAAGYIAWQFTDQYLGDTNQDASVLLQDSLARLKA